MKENEAASGPSTPDSFASYDPATSSWRTSQLSLLEGSGEFSETWPRAGMTRSGTAYPRPPSAPLTGGTGSGLWPTPQTAYDGRSDEAWAEAKARAAEKHASGQYGKGTGAPGMMDLQRAVKMWPTPCATDAKDVPYQKGKNGQRYPMLTGAVMPEKMWPTPTARDYRSPGTPERLAQARQESSRGQPLTEVVGGQLNPTWVEWLMGYPLGWTVLEGWATRLSRKSRNGSPAASQTRKRGG